MQAFFKRFVEETGKKDKEVIIVHFDIKQFGQGGFRL